jgi:RNA polymerase sigma-70 factor (ECF subfamily)
LVRERKGNTVSLDIEGLYRRYGPMVLRRCRQLLQNEEKAMDAMQDTFVAVLRHEKKLHAAAPSSLLYRIATNTCLNIMRSERRRPQAGSDEALLSVASGDDPEAKVLNRHYLNWIFKAEKPSTRVMAVLHYVDGMTLEEVAREVGLSVSGVRKRLRTLRTRVKSLERDGAP